MKTLVLTLAGALRSKSGYTTLSGRYVPPPSPGLWPLATLVFAAIAVVGAAFMLAARSSESD